MNSVTIPFNLTKVSGSLAGADPKWQAHVIPAGIIQYPQLCGAIADDSNRSSEDVEYIGKCGWKTAIAYVRQGYIVHIGEEVVLRPVIRGSFPTKDAPFDPSVNEAIMSILTNDATRNYVLTVYVNEGDAANPNVLSANIKVSVEAA